MVKYAALVVVCAVAVFPFAWMVLTSLRSTAEVYHTPPLFFPLHWTLSAYAQVWSRSGLFVDFGNSVLVAGVTTFLALALSTLAGYGFSRYRLPGGRAMMLVILFTQMFPAILLLIPFYVLMRQFHLLDTLQGLMITYTSFALPLSTWIMRNYFLTVPLTLDEAALVDGCSRIGSLWRIIIPVAIPGILTTAVFSFITAWDEFMFADTFVSSPHLFTLPLALQSFIGQYSTKWNLLTAGSVIVTIPVVVLILVLQRHIVAGLASGSVKG